MKKMFEMCKIPLRDDVKQKFLGMISGIIENLSVSNRISYKYLLN